MSGKYKVGDGSLAHSVTFSVRSGLVWEPWHYKYSSAIDHYTNEQGLLSIEHL